MALAKRRRNSTEHSYALPTIMTNVVNEEGEVIANMEHILPMVYRQRAGCVTNSQEKSTKRLACFEIYRLYKPPPRVMAAHVIPFSNEITLRILLGQFIDMSG